MAGFPIMELPQCHYHTIGLRFMASDTAGEHMLLSVMTSMGKGRVIFINVALCSGEYSKHKKVRWSEECRPSHNIVSLESIKHKFIAISVAIFPPVCLRKCNGTWL